MHEEWLKLLQTHLPEAKAVWEKREAGDQVIFVSPESIVKVCQFLKKDERTAFNVLQVITGCDYLDENDPRIEVSYILASFIKKTELILKVKLPRQNPQIDSVCSVWKAADFQERECFDMLGVEFKSHPDLRRILCPEDWEGFPLRKDYVAAKTYLGMEIYPEEKMNFPEREFAEKQKAAEKARKKAAGVADTEEEKNSEETVS